MSSSRALGAFLRQDLPVNPGLIARGVLVSYRLGSWGLTRASSRREALACRLGAALGRVVFGKLLDAGALDPRATFGPRLELPHNLAGSIVHPMAVVGADCKLFQRVTLGTNEHARGDLGAPRIGDGVTLGAGCCVLGAVTVGDGAVIGANAVVLADVPAGATAVGVPARVLEGRAELHPDVVARLRAEGRDV